MTTLTSSTPFSGRRNFEVDFTATIFGQSIKDVQQLVLNFRKTSYAKEKYRKKHENKGSGDAWGTRDPTKEKKKEEKKVKKKVGRRGMNWSDCCGGIRRGKK